MAMLLDRRLIIRFITVGAPAGFIPHPISIELPLHLGKPHNIIAVLFDWTQRPGSSKNEENYNSPQNGVTLSGGSSGLKVQVYASLVVSE